MRGHVRAGAAAAGLVALVAAAGCGRDPSALDPRSDHAADVAALWWVMLAVGVAVLTLVTVLLLRTVRMRPAGRRPEEPRPDDDDERAGRRWLLWGGVALPVVVLVPLFAWVVVLVERLEAGAGSDAVTVEVTGHQFWWEARYRDLGVVTANELHVPVGREVRFVLSSADVIHSFWVPNVAGKRDLVPGEVTELVVTVDEPGVYRGFCAEFCGVQHARMQLLVIAEAPDDFDAWAAAQAADAVPPTTPEERAGAAAFTDVGCASCHRIRGTDASGAVGPDLTHVASRRTLGAVTVDNDRGHLGGWIANSQTIKPGNLMPPMVLEADQLNALIAYLESLE